jgi:hypothetical protein
MKNLAIYTFLGILNFSMLIAVIAISGSNAWMLPLFLTLLSFFSSTCYFVIIMIFQMHFYYHIRKGSYREAHREHKLYVFVRERIFKFVFTAEVTVCIAFWGLVLCGPTIMVLGDDVGAILMSVYLHFIIGLQIFMEFMLSKRKLFPELFTKDLIILMCMVAVYSTIIIVVAKTSHNYVYPFLKLEIQQIIIVNLVLLMLSFNVYHGYHYLLEKLTKKEIRSELNLPLTADGEKKVLI